LTDSRRPPAELKEVSNLSDQNPVATLYEIILVLNANLGGLTACDQVIFDKI